MLFHLAVFNSFYYQEKTSIMKKKIDSWNKIIPWLFGFLLSTAGMFLGYNLGSDTASLLGGEPGILARLGKGFVWGGVIASLQWPIIRTVGVLPLRFIFAGAVGFTIGYPFGQTIQSFLIYNWNLHLTGYWLCVTTFGLFIGVTQWLILRQQMNHASLWILFSVIGWILTGLAWLNSGSNSGIESILYGIITGFGFVWIVHFQNQTKDNGAVN
jgi:hypothetical protein